MQQGTPTTPQQRMATEKISKLVLSYSIPTIIGMLVNAMYNVIDRFWVGKIPDIGTAALTGIGLCMPVMNVIMGFAQLVGIGAAAAISLRLGKEDKDGAENILGNALTLSVLIGIVVSIVGLLFGTQILTAVGADANMMVYALPYYNIIVGGSVIGIVSFSMNHPIRATGNPKRFASTQLLGGICNMILDPIFIFGLDMGIQGAAIATIISQSISCIWVMAYYYTGVPNLRIKKAKLFLKKAIIMPIFAIGMAPFLMQITASFVTVIANYNLKFYGDLELSDGNIAIGAMTVIMSLTMIFLMPLFGINQGTQPIIGYNYGAGNLDRVKDALKWSVIYSFIICCFGFVVVEAFAPQLIAAFNADAELIETGATGMRIFLCMLPLVGLQIPLVNFYSAIGKAKISLILSQLRQVIFLIPSYIFLPKFLGLTGMWIAGPLSDFLACMITLIFIRRELKNLKLEH